MRFGKCAMSLVIIRRALEKHLAAMTPAIAIAYENAGFSPQAGIPYQRVNLLPTAPDNSPMSVTNYFEVGIFQVTLVYPSGTGPGAAALRANLLRYHFRRGTTLVEAGVNIRVIRTPAVAGGLIDGGNYNVPVSIRYEAEIFLLL